MVDIQYNKIGELIRTKRKEMGLNQGELADKLKDFNIYIGQKTISNYEKGDPTKKPDYNTVAALQSILGITGLTKMYFPYIEDKKNSTESSKSKEDAAPSEPEIILQPVISEAVDLGYIDDEEVELNNSGCGFIDLGPRGYAMLVPKVPDQYAYASNVEAYSDIKEVAEWDTQAIIVDKKHNGTYRAFEVKNDSMDSGDEDAITPGDIAIARQLDKQHWTSKLHIGDYSTWIIVRKSGIIIKQITDHNVKKAEITIHSTNPTYKDEQISLGEVDQLWNVQQIVKNKKRKGRAHSGKSDFRHQTIKDNKIDSSGITNPTGPKKGLLRKYDIREIMGYTNLGTRVWHNGLAPRFPRGSYFSLVPKTDLIIVPGDYYALETDDELYICRLYYNDDNTGFLCVNTNPERYKDDHPLAGKLIYPPYPVPFDSVKQIYNLFAGAANLKSSIIQIENKKEAG